MNCKALVLALVFAVAGCNAMPTVQERSPQQTRIEVAFSPNGGATALVVSAIDAARREILVQAYGFTSRPIAEALVHARQRGVAVRVILDKSQRSQRGSLGEFIAAQGIEVGVDAKHAIAHNKVMVIDGEAVVTGSFNFTASAESRNAENVLILRGSPETVLRYRENWETHRTHSEDW